MPIDDDWTSAASANDSLIAELLLRLKHSREAWTQTPTKATTTITKASSSAFRWGARKTRSRLAASRFASVMMKSEYYYYYKDRATRSPTTPLSWSGGATSVSASATGDGYEASSVTCHRSTSSRSKVCQAQISTLKSNLLHLLLLLLLPLTLPLLLLLLPLPLPLPLPLLPLPLLLLLLLLLLPFTSDFDCACLTRLTGIETYGASLD